MTGETAIAIGTGIETDGDQGRPITARERPAATNLTPIPRAATIEPVSVRIGTLVGTEGKMAVGSGNGIVMIGEGIQEETMTIDQGEIGIFSTTGHAVAREDVIVMGLVEGGGIEKRVLLLHRRRKNLLQT
jgi:hypothetical protein